MREALSLFTGSGIVDKVFQVVGFNIKGQVEIDDYCTALLERHYPDVPRARDIKTVGRKQLTSWGIGHTIDLIFGGPPCQPFSNAGKRRGKADDRHLWPQMYRLVRMLHPRAVFFENVLGIIPMVLDDILADLESEGYEAIPFVVPACAIGASHRRDRVFIVAYTNEIGRTALGPERSLRQWFATVGRSGAVDDTTNERLSQWRPNQQPASASEALAGMDAEPERPGSMVHARCLSASRGNGYEAGRQPVGEASQSGVGRADALGAGLEVGQSLSGNSRQKQPTTQRNRGIALPKADSEPPQRSAITWPECGTGATLARLDRAAHGDTRWLDCPRWPVPPGKEQEAWEAPRTAADIVNRTHRLKVIGNAMVPQVVYPFAQAIYQTLEAEGVTQ